ncbi:leucyl/phenylalanyl-tRNA--protein transferase [Parasediminibacterium paludis]|uniref:Leucyl/phenylalanyl-tRNA--protein transferase n=1 Tax=Parasediminibacterium paludis TaxID=908966 RepID=A0ABV8PVF1_9BACT
MPLAVLDHKFWFPNVEEALEDGLLAIGGDLHPERILLAYKKGIFPWYDGDLPLWWCPNPRFILIPEELKISKSMKALFKKQAFDITINTNFEAVINACKATERKGQDGTWIKNEVVEAYTHLHKLGMAHSVEAWQNNQLVGGLYGIKLGKVFFGESMFSKVSNASKYAFISFVDQLKREGIVLIDCQVYTEHLESLGAKMILRQQFVHLLEQLI